MFSLLLSVRYVSDKLKTEYTRLYIPALLLLYAYESGVLVTQPDIA